MTEAGLLKKGDYVAQVIPKEIAPVSGVAEEDARLYGILLGDGHCSKNGLEWGVSGNPDKDAHIDFVTGYLSARGIHYWVKNRRENYLQIGWAAGTGLARDATTGQFVTGRNAWLYFQL